MKHINLKSILFSLIFIVAAAILSANVLAGEFVTVDRVNCTGYQPDDGSGDDTTDGGIRNPGPGH